MDFGTCAWQRISSSIIRNFMVTIVQANMFRRTTVQANNLHNKRGFAIMLLLLESEL